jgi:class 3 adenylate cyclase
VTERPETRYARSVDGAYIGYQVLGDGPVDLVYVPTWWSNVDAQWDVPEIAEFLTLLSRFSRLIMFDKRGVGVSDPVPLASLPTLEEWMDDLRVVLDAVGSERAALHGVLGGGLMCLLFAATYPERVSTLILRNSYARVVAAPDYQFGRPAAEIEPFIEAFVRGWPTGVGPDPGADGAVPDRERLVLARYQRLSASPGTVAALLRMTVAVDVRQVVPAVRNPTVLLYDEAVPGRRSALGQMNFAYYAEWLRDHLPQAQMSKLSTFRRWPGTRESWLEAANKLEEILTGVHGHVDPDRVLATVLFTDIVASTEGVVEHGDRAWTDLLDRFRSTVRLLVRQFRGREVNTRGDDLLVTFDGPARAIRCAQAITAATRGLGLEARVGLHTGEVELLGDDIAGIAVHIGQRVSALAGPGEVLVSRTVTDLVAGSGVEFADRGEHELKGVPGVWRLYAVDE